MAVRMGLSHAVLNVGLALVFLAFGYAKFFAYEAAAVQPLISTHPALSWLPAAFGIDGVARFLGIFELTTAMLLVAGLWRPSANIVAGAMTIITFLITTSFLLLLPGGFEPSAGGFPALSTNGQFLFKDIALLAAGVAILGHGLKVRASSRTQFAGD